MKKLTDAEIEAQVIEIKKKFSDDINTLTKEALIDFMRMVRNWKEERNPTKAMEMLAGQLYTVVGSAFHMGYNYGKEEKK